MALECVLKEVDDSSLCGESCIPSLQYNGEINVLVDSFNVESGFSV